MSTNDEWSVPYRVFIVDDHPLIRKVLTRFLTHHANLDVLGAAASAEEALVRLDQLDPQLILVDFSLPGINGIELIARLQKRRPNVRCLLLSSHHARMYADRALAAGAYGYVAKGNPDALLRAIGEVGAGRIAIELDLNTGR